ncbi:putative dual specificity protein phosphatase DSP8 [Bienertia sinuspersici]
MKHVIIPTRNYLYAPSFNDINTAVDLFISYCRGNASCGRGTYVHCKAKRGRSTTIALCYLVKNKQMTFSNVIDLIRAK